MPKSALVILVGVALLAACSDEFFFDPAPPSAEVAVSYDLSRAARALGGSPQAFDEADEAQLRVEVQGEVLFEDRLALEAVEGSGDKRVQIQVDLEEAEARALVSLSLLGQGSVLFTGGTELLLEAGETASAELSLDPVAAAVRAPVELDSIRGLGQSVQLGAVAVFATGDTIRGAEIRWTALDQTISVASDGTVTSQAFGTGRVAASFQDRGDTVRITVTDPCQESPPVGLGQEISGILEASDCETERGLTDWYELDIDTPATLVFQGSSPDFAPVFQAYDDQGVRRTDQFVGSESRVPVALGPGAYRLRIVVSFRDREAGNVAGSYTFSVQSLPADFAGCPWIFLAPDVEINGTIDPGPSNYLAINETCRDEFNPEIERWFDAFVFRAFPDKSYRVRVTSPISSILSVFELGGPFLRTGYVPAGETITQWVSPSDTMFLSTFPLNDQPGVQGPYTLTLTESEEALGEVTGVVTSVDTGEPVEFAQVTLVEGQVSTHTEGVFAGGTFTDAQGSYRIQAPRNQVYSLFVTAPGFQEASGGTLDFGASGSFTVDVELQLPGSPPSLTITHLRDGSTLPLGWDVGFRAAATDPEDGDLSSEVHWTSSIDGDLGVGAGIFVGLSAGTHTLTASVTDLDGRYVEDSITVTVLEPGSVPITGTETIFDFDLTPLPNGAPYQNITWRATFSSQDPVSGNDDIVTNVYGGASGSNRVQQRNDTNLIMSNGGTLYGPLITANAVFDPMLDGVFSFGLFMSSGTSTVTTFAACGNDDQGRKVECMTITGGQ